MLSILMLNIALRSKVVLLRAIMPIVITLDVVWLYVV
jgi:hypothetical protein